MQPTGGSFSGSGGFRLPVLNDRKAGHPLCHAIGLSRCLPDPFGRQVARHRAGGYVWRQSEAQKPRPGGGEASGDVAYEALSAIMARGRFSPAFFGRNAPQWLEVQIHHGTTWQTESVLNQGVRPRLLGQLQEIGGYRAVEAVSRRDQARGDFEGGGHAVLAHCQNVGAELPTF